MLDPERAQIEKLEPTLFDIVLRPEEFISESSLEDESDYLEEIPAALIPLLSPQEPEEEQQPLDPNDYDQFRYYRISANSFCGNYSFLNLTLCTVTFGYSTHTCKNLIPMVVTRAMANSSKNHALLMCRI